MMVTFRLKTVVASVLAAGMFGAGAGVLSRGTQAEGALAEKARVSAEAQPLIDADFSTGDFAALGWKAEGGWDVFTHPPKTANNPGAVARFPANKPDGSLTRTFAEVRNPRRLRL